MTCKANKICVFASFLLANSAEGLCFCEDFLEKVPEKFGKEILKCYLCKTKSF